MRPWVLRALPVARRRELDAIDISGRWDVDGVEFTTPGNRLTLDPTEVLCPRRTSSSTSGSAGHLAGEDYESECFGRPRIDWSAFT